MNDKNLAYLITNARSLRPKILSLMDYINDLDLTLSIITETWFYEGEAYNKLKDDLKEDQRLEIISLFRPKNANGTRRTGGGVSIIYNPAKIRLKEYKINNRK